MGLFDYGSPIHNKGRYVELEIPKNLMPFYDQKYYEGMRTIELPDGTYNIVAGRVYTYLATIYLERQIEIRETKQCGYFTK